MSDIQSIVLLSDPMFAGRQKPTVSKLTPMKRSELAILGVEDLAVGKYGHLNIYM